MGNSAAIERRAVVSGWALALAAALWAGSALPVLAAPTPKRMLRRMDRNGDGVIERSEWLNPPHAFNTIDKNHDGVITPAEIRARFDGAAGGNAESPAAGNAIMRPSHQPIQWIDVHTHPNGDRRTSSGYKDAVRAGLSIMDPSHIALLVLMPTPMVQESSHNGSPVMPVPIENWIGEVRTHPGRAVFMGGGGSLNSMIHDDSPHGHPSAALKKRFASRARKILDEGAAGFGEIAIMHLSLAKSHPYENVPADHPLLLELADIAARNDVPIDVHFDPVLHDMARPDYLSNSNPPVLKRNIDAFERFLDHNPKARISWAHVGSDMLGFWSADFTRKMLAKHPNLYMSLRMGVGKSRKNFPLGPDGVRPEWLQTFKAFPDRFFLGGDQFFVGRDAHGPPLVFAKHAATVRRNANRLLSLLPEDLARKIGYENAEAFYKIKPH